MSGNIHLSSESFQKAIQDAINVGRADQQEVVLKMIDTIIQRATEKELDGSFIAGLVTAQELIKTHGLGLPK